MEEKRKTSNNNILGWITRLVLVAIILGITSFLTPGFTINGLCHFYWPQL